MGSIMEEEEVGFSSSKLGTKDYWDSCYVTENDNFDDHGDVGEVWFGDEASARVVQWLEDREQEGELTIDDAIMDVGCGNGMLCVDLYKAGFTQITGVDYSEGAIDLAKKIADQAVEKSFLNSFKHVTDKGTFDAISLSESADENKVKYVESVNKMLNFGGLLLITSCNWTESELKKHLSEYFFHQETVPTPTFSFGGKTGKSTTFCIFKKK